jgi:hypothetical protein
MGGHAGADIDGFDESGRPIWNKENVQRARLRVEQRRWEASKQWPERFGDRVGISGVEGAPPLIPAVDPEDITNRQLARSILAILRDAQTEGRDALDVQVVAGLVEGTVPAVQLAVADDIDDGDDAPQPAADIPENEYAIGDVVPLAHGYHARCAQVADDPPIALWWIVSPQRRNVTCVRGLPEARRAVEEIVRTGSYSKHRMLAVDSFGEVG